MPEPGHEVPVTMAKVPNVSLSRGNCLEGRTPPLAACDIWVVCRIIVRHMDHSGTKCRIAPRSNIRASLLLEQPRIVPKDRLVIETLT